MKARLLLFILLILRQTTHAQNMLGLVTSRFAGTNALALNPALGAANPHQFYLNIATASGHVSNNYAQYVGVNSLLNMVARGKNLLPQDIQEIPKDGLKSGDLLTDWRGPALMISLKNKNSLALTTRLRSGFQLRDASKTLLGLVRTKLDDPDFYNKSLRDDAFKINSNLITEIGVTYSQVVYEQGKHFLSVGGTVKRVSGVFSAHFINKGMNYRVEPAGQIDEGLMFINQISGELGYTTADGISKFSVDPSQILQKFKPNWFWGQGTPGAGWGLDLGLVYEFRPVESADYKLRVGVSLVDLGAVQYKTNTKKFAFDNKGRTIDFEHTLELSTVEAKLQLTDANNIGQFRAGLPTALNLTADMRLSDDFYINATVIQNMAAAGAVGMRQPSLWGIIPRFESKGSGIALPINHINGAFRVGIAVRLGLVVLGSDNVLDFVNNRARGADIYAGLAVMGLRKKKP